MPRSEVIRQSAPYGARAPMMRSLKMCWRRYRPSRWLQVVHACTAAWSPSARGRPRPCRSGPGSGAGQPLTQEKRPARHRPGADYYRARPCVIVERGLRLGRMRASGISRSSLTRVSTAVIKFPGDDRLNRRDPPPEILEKPAMGTESTLFRRLYEMDLTSLFNEVDRVPRSQPHVVSCRLGHPHLTLLVIRVDNAIRAKGSSASSRHPTSRWRRRSGPHSWDGSSQRC